MNTILITAGHGQGKTTTLLQLANRLIARGESVTGVVERAFIVNGHRIAYFFESLPNRELFLAAKRRHFERRVDAFEFFSPAFKRAGELILRPSKWCFVDEIGILEAQGRGLWPAVVSVLEGKSAENLVLGVRDGLVEDIADRIGQIKKS